MREVHIDCEFIRGDLSPSGLISIGLWSGGSRYYAVNAEMDVRGAYNRPWMKENVWRHIPSSMDGSLDKNHPDVAKYSVISREVDEWFRALCPSDDSRDDIRLLAHCGAQDMVRLHGLWYHEWETMPTWIPRYFHDLEEDVVDLGLRGEDLPQQDPATAHHAFYDAVHNEVVWDFLRERRSV